MIRNLITFIVLLFFLQSNAQYLREVGLFVGGTNYSGDLGNELFIFPNRVGAGFIYKRNINSRISTRLSYNYLPIGDDDANSFNVVRQERELSFKNTINEMTIGLEFNYFDYDIMSVYNGFSPYLFVEFAGIYSEEKVRTEGYTDYSMRKSFNYAIPFGIGFKSRITDRLGYALELRSHYTFSDTLDSNNAANSEREYENPKTNDWFFFTGASLTYSFGRPPCFAPR